MTIELAGFPHSIEEVKKHYEVPETLRPPFDIEELRVLAQGKPDLEEGVKDMEDQFTHYTEANFALAEFDFKKIDESLSEEELRDGERLAQNWEIARRAMVDSIKIAARAFENKRLDISWARPGEESTARYHDAAILNTYKKMLYAGRETTTNHE